MSEESKYYYISSELADILELNINAKYSLKELVTSLQLYIDYNRLIRCLNNNLDFVRCDLALYLLFNLKEFVIDDIPILLQSKRFKMHINVNQFEFLEYSFKNLDSLSSSNLKEYISCTLYIYTTNSEYKGLLKGVEEEYLILDMYPTKIYKEYKKIKLDDIIKCKVLNSLNYKMLIYNKYKKINSKL
jgi:hypothetical protein